MNLLKDFIKFLKSPRNDSQIDIINITSFITVGLYVVLSMILFDLISGIIISPLKFLKLTPPLKDFQYNFYNIIRIALILPVIEELVFRLPLRITKNNIIVCISSIIFILFYRNNLLLTSITSLLIILIGLLFLNKDSKFILFFKNLFNSKFAIIFYSQAILFGGLHLMNYDLDIKRFLIFPFIILNQIVIGLFLGFVRVRYSHGIFICIFSHILVNSLYSLILAN